MRIKINFSTKTLDSESPKKTTKLISFGKVFTTLLVCLVTIGYLENVAAQTSDIDATIQLSICGNGIKEGGEECDNTDLNEKKCSSFGHTNGTLTCNPDCSFNTRQCFTVEKTKTDNNNSKVNSFTNAENPNSNEKTDEFNQNIQQDPRTDNFTIFAKPSLPERLKIYDLNNDNIISTDEMEQALLRWASFWTEDDKDNCDINIDYACNTIDFSILLHHINKR